MNERLDPDALDAAGKALYLAQHPDGDWDRAKETVLNNYGRDWTRPAAEAISAYLAAAPKPTSTALDAHDRAIKAQTLREAAQKLVTGSWPQGHLPGIEAAARELLARAELMEAEGE